MFYYEFPGKSHNKGEVILFLIKHHNMRVYGGVVVHKFLTLVLDERKWLDS